MEKEKTAAHLVEVDISPPDYLDPVLMLRNLADDMEKGKFGKVTSIAISTFGDNGLDIFGGGEDSSGPTIALLFHAAHTQFATALLEAAMSEVKR
jgi:hypothetical protein